MAKETLFEKFKSYKINIENISEKSLKQYEEVLNRFCKYHDKTLDDDDFIKSLTAKDVKDYIEYLAKGNKQPTTRNKFLAVIKAFYKYLYTEEEINIDSKILFIKKSKGIYKEKLWLDKEEIEKYINSISCIRTKAMVEMLCYTGMRYSEIINITIEDFLNGKTIITGKGNKQREVFFGNEKLKEDVSNYILTKRKRIIKKTGKNTDILFINNKGNKIIAQNFIRSLKLYAKFNRGNEMSPHKLRHSFITNALLQGEPIAVVRDAVGHSNIAVTNSYAHSTKKSIENLMNKGRGDDLKDEREMFGLI